MEFIGVGHLGLGVHGDLVALGGEQHVQAVEGAVALDGKQVAAMLADHAVGEEQTVELVPRWGLYQALVQGDGLFPFRRPSRVADDDCVVLAAVQRGLAGAEESVFDALGVDSQMEGGGDVAGRQQAGQIEQQLLEEEEASADEGFLLFEAVKLEFHVDVVESFEAGDHAVGQQDEVE